MTEAKAKSTKAPTERQPNSYKPVDCKANLNEMCKAINAWGKEWETWGNDITNELDELKGKVDQLINHTGMPKGPGGPPTDATKPPKPPFNP